MKDYAAIHAAGAGQQSVETSGGAGAPSFVEITLDAVDTGRGVGTLLRVRESRFDAAVVVDGLLRGPLAHARG